MSPESDTRPASFWFFTGMKGITSLPALILMTSFVGFSAFALESGITRGEAMFMTFGVWALPAQMILVGMMSAGAPLAACFIAVTLSSIRMMPMVASIVPDMRTRKTPTWLLLFASHFIAITAWVFAIRTLRDVPREHRAIYFLGFGLTLTTVNTIIVAVCYGLVARFPPLVAGTLFMLTPVYFIASIWATAQHTVVKLAFVVGIVGGPVMALIAPEFDVLYAGIGGGTLAYLVDRFWIRKTKWRGGAR
jgi:predicted branched-subunit amino acid permease